MATQHTKLIAKVKLRTGNCNQDCINLDTRRATMAGKTQEKMEEKAEKEGERMRWRA